MKITPDLVGSKIIRHIPCKGDKSYTCEPLEVYYVGKQFMIIENNLPPYKETALDILHGPWDDGAWELFSGECKCNHGFFKKAKYCSECGCKL